MTLVLTFDQLESTTRLKTAETKPLWQVKFGRENELFPLPIDSDLQLRSEKQGFPGTGLQ